MNVSTVSEHIEKINRAAEAPDTELRQIAAMKIGEYVRQGDVYVERIEALGNGTTTTPAGSRQVAVGTTIGSRHVAEGDALDVVRVVGESPSALLGPVVIAHGRWRLTHPEHAHFELPEGRYRVRYQRDVASERAVVD